MSAGKPKRMPLNESKWENELWRLVGHGNGKICPLFKQCEIRRSGEFCPYDHQNQIKGISFASLLSTNRHDVAEFKKILQYHPRKRVAPGRVFQIVDRLAAGFVNANQALSGQLPLSADLIKDITGNLNTEVRSIPLRAYHGAVWHLQDRAVIYLNANDSPDKQRLTLFHEAFHILVHSKTVPVIEKQPGHYNSFIEMLADYFAGCIVMPRNLVQEKWAQFKDIKRLAAAFHVTESAMWIRLEGLGLI